MKHPTKASVLVFGPLVALVGAVFTADSAQALECELQIPSHQSRIVDAHKAVVGCAQDLAESLGQSDPGALTTGGVSFAQCYGVWDYLYPSLSQSAHVSAAVVSSFDTIHGAIPDLWVVYQAAQEFRVWLENMDAPPPDHPAPKLSWSYQCEADFWINGDGWGNVLRNVTIEVPSPGGYTPVGIPCEYLVGGCTVPATYLSPAHPAGGDEHDSDMHFDTDRGFFFNPPMPVTVDVCLNPMARTVNRSQVPAVDLLLVHPAYDLLDETLCSRTCIQYQHDEETECLAPNE